MRAGTVSQALSAPRDPTQAHVWTREPMHEPMRMSSTAQTARPTILSQLTRLPALLLLHTMVLKTQLKLLPKAFNSLITQCVWERKADKASLVSFMISLTPRSWQWFLRDSTTSAMRTQWLQLNREGISREQLWPGLQPGLGRCHPPSTRPPASSLHPPDHSCGSTGTSVSTLG